MKANASPMRSPVEATAIPGGSHPCIAWLDACVTD